jgi:hypothetical protein
MAGLSELRTTMVLVLGLILMMRAVVAMDARSGFPLILALANTDIATSETTVAAIPRVITRNSSIGDGG